MDRPNISYLINNLSCLEILYHRRVKSLTGGGNPVEKFWRGWSGGGSGGGGDYPFTLDVNGVRIKICERIVTIDGDVLPALSSLPAAYVS